MFCRAKNTLLLLNTLIYNFSSRVITLFDRRQITTPTKMALSFFQLKLLRFFN